MTKISIIVAAAENDVIGKDNRLLWKLSNDMKHFKELTTGYPVIMGRKTYESIGKPLPNRKNIIITRDKDYIADGCTVVNSIESALESAAGSDEVFIIGGEQIYNSFWNKADTIHLTRVHTTIEGDVHIPAISSEQWKEISRSCHAADEKNEYDHTILTYIRK